MNREQPSTESPPCGEAREMCREAPFPNLWEAQVLLIEVQPVDGVRLVAVPGVLDLGLSRVRLLGNAVQSEW